MHPQTLKCICLVGSSMFFTGNLVAQESSPIVNPVVRDFRVLDIGAMKQRGNSLRVLGFDQQLSIFLEPFYESSQGANVTGTQLILREGNKRLRLSRSTIKINDGENFESYSLGYTRSFDLKEEGLGYDLSVLINEREQNGRSLGFSAGFSKQFSSLNSTNMTFYGDIKWVEDKSPFSPDMHEVGGILGLSTEISNTFVVQMNYVFEDDLNQEEIFEIASYKTMTLYDVKTEVGFRADTTETVSISLLIYL